MSEGHAILNRSNECSIPVLWRCPREAGIPGVFGTGAVEVIDVVANRKGPSYSGPDRAVFTCDLAVTGVTAGARRLLARADSLLSESISAGSAQDLFLGAYLAALRGAGAVLADVEGTAGGRSRRTRNAWVRLAESAPELASWSDFFAQYSATRAAVEAGASRSLSAAEADRFFTEVGRFLHEVESYLVGHGQLDQHAS